MSEAAVFLVLGLGSLGQHCVLALKEFGVPVIGIEHHKPQEWELPEVGELLDDLIVGDICHDPYLHQAQVARCRAALIVTSNERVNAEAALAIRQLNPETRLVVRSSKENLNRLLSDRLGNFCAFDPTLLPAMAFAIAALDPETVGFFQLQGQWLRVVQQRMDATHPWCDRRPLHEVDSRRRRLLSCVQPEQDALNQLPLLQWEAEHRLTAGDIITYVETAEAFLIAQQQQTRHHPQPQSTRYWPTHWQDLGRDLGRWGRRFLQLSFQQQIRRVAILCGCIVILLSGLGTVLFTLHLPQLPWLRGFYITATLLLGGYGDLFGGLAAVSAELPWWLELFALGLTVTGTAFVGILYALLTEALLTSQFKFNRQRPQVPPQGHTVIVGLGRVGQRIGQLLQEFRQAIVGITLRTDLDETVLPTMPLVMGNLNTALSDANVATAHSVIVATDDEMLNLEVALTTRSLNPGVRLAIRTVGQRLSNHLTQLFPQDQVLCTYAVMAEAFAGAAFGEQILSLFRVHNQTVLVTEYEIEAIDTLHDQLLSELSEGYHILPLLHQRPQKPPQLLPSADQRVKVGDRLVVLATIEGLQRVEVGQQFPKNCHVQITKLATREAQFEGANILSRITGCSLQTARQLMQDLPVTLPQPLHQRQAQRLVRTLRRAQISASWERL
ncbi:MAG: potassium channel family protein [Spirulinaceae cyanobacterium]